MSSLHASPVVLVAALDWGLGHATRCIPIVQNLLARGLSVRLAGSGASGILLQTAFPELPYSEIPAHPIRYARRKTGFLWKLLLQMPRLQQNVAWERRWLSEEVARRAITVVLSDNRYGLYHPQVHTVLITHQLEIQTPLGAWANRLVQQLHYRLINRFHECWVPDGQAPGLAGALAHPRQLPACSTRFIGPLSRFQRRQDPKRYELAIVLSGPEPQRSIWEQLLCTQLADCSMPVLLVRGLPAGGAPLHLPASVSVAHHLPAADLEAALAASAFVLARCGYSTVMDVVALGCRSILVPTPGQTEQEYLARHLMAQGLALCLLQQQFDLAQALAMARTFAYRILPEADAGPINAALDALPIASKR